MNDTSIVGPSFVRGGAGSDRLEVDGASLFSVAPRVQSFEGNDVPGGRLQAADVYNDLILDGARLGTITELAVLTPNLSTLVGALQATGLTGALSGPGPFTVFAPLNSAFAKISGVVSGLTVNQLSDVLKFHVVSGAVSLAGLIGVPLANMQVRDIGIIGYGVVAPLVFLLLGIVFGRVQYAPSATEKFSNHVVDRRHDDR